jgi:bis(5'-nucleosidyl)-tetraphosphatase
MPRPRTEHAFSAGGVVFRRVATPPGSAEAPVPSGYEIVLVGRARDDFWVLPKGTPAPGETTEEVALREVREETGVSARVVEQLGSIHYWFSRRGVRFNKEVLYYLMEATGGDIALHDHEYDDARWFPLAGAASRLAYENEAEIMRQAAARLAGRAV